MNKCFYLLNKIIKMQRNIYNYYIILCYFDHSISKYNLSSYDTNDICFVTKLIVSRTQKYYGIEKFVCLSRALTLMSQQVTYKNDKISCFFFH